MKGKRCLVTGSGGFIGKHLVNRLLAEGAIVHAVYHGKLRYIGECPQIITEVCDLTDYVDVGCICRDIDYVFHLAENTGGILTKVSPVQDVRENLVMHLNMLDACHYEGVQKFVCLTGTTGYPNTGVPIFEGLMFGNKPPEVYKTVGNVKRMMEMSCDLYENLQTIILRPSSVYGPHDNFGDFAHIIPSLIQKMCGKRGCWSNCSKVEIFGDGNEKRDFIYIDDLIDAIILSVTTPVYTPLNIAYGESYSIIEVIDLISKILDKPCEIYLKELPHTNNGRMKPISRKFNNELAKTTLNWKPQISLEEGLSRTINWYKNGQ